MFSPVTLAKLILNLLIPKVLNECCGCTTLTDSKLICNDCKILLSNGATMNQSHNTLKFLLRNQCWYMLLLSSRSFYSDFAHTLAQHSLEVSNLLIIFEFLFPTVLCSGVLGVADSYLSICFFEMRSNIRFCIGSMLNLS